MPYVCVAFYTKAQIAFIMAALLYDFLPETFLQMFSEVFHREEIDWQLFLLHDYSLERTFQEKYSQVARSGKQNKFSELRFIFFGRNYRKVCR